VVKLKRTVVPLLKRRHISTATLAGFGKRQKGKKSPSDGAPPRDGGSNEQEGEAGPTDEPPNEDRTSKSRGE